MHDEEKVRASELPEDDAERVNELLREGTLLILLHRAGGTIAFTEADYFKVAETYGGPGRWTVDYVVDDAGGPTEHVVVTLRAQVANAPGRRSN